MPDDSDLATQPHDGFFKNQFSKIEIARALFQSKLPRRLVDQADWSQLKIEPVSFIKESLKQLHSDLIFTLPVGDHPTQIGLIFEHQTQVDPLMPFRFGEYQMEYLRRQLQKGDTPFPPILCILIHQGPEKWHASTQFSDLYRVPEHLRDVLSPFIPQFQHLLIDLTQIDPTQENEPKLRVILNLMKLARMKDKLLDFYRWLASEFTFQLEDQLLQDCLIYGLHIDQTIDFKAICDTVRHNQELSAKTMTIAQQLHNEGLEKGLEKGLQKGRQEGRQEGEFAVCHRLLERKFPGLAERIKPQLMVMDEERLLAFTEALLFFQTEQDCCDWFKA
jgi:predicted transposase/invertase (TIGR01784 family)